MKATIIHKKPNAIKELIRRMKGVPQIAVGFPRGKATSAQYPNGVSVLDVAFYNNFGTKTKSGKQHIPARRFMDIGGKKASIELSGPIQKMTKAVANGKMMMADMGEMVGMKAVAIFQKEITDLSEPPNAASTIKKKKSSNPLISSGLLRQTISYDVRKK